MSDGEVYNGADDDGSGTVAIMQISEAFQRQLKMVMDQEDPLYFYT